MRYIYSSFIIGLICWTCTGKTNFKKELQQMYSRSICLSSDSMRCVFCGSDTLIQYQDLSMKLIVYSDSSACSSCTLKTMYKWDKFIKQIQQYQGRLQIVFIFSPLKKDMNIFNLTMKTMAPSSPIYVDTLGIFSRLNPQIPSNPALHTFLLDEQNNVILVGDPIKNKKIEELFWQIVEEKLGKRE